MATRGMLQLMRASLRWETLAAPSATRARVYGRLPRSLP